jgi:hypothetical protein
MIPRDITCWYCQRDQHAQCFSTIVCACRTCDWEHRPASAAPINPITAALRPH